MVCEQFGNTLAISRETRLKIERTVLPTPEPVTVRFLKAKVGFKKHDCAVQLGSNQAGLRFLALAAALVSSLTPFDCAEALMLMLETTTSDTRLLPSTRHLKDLMSALEPRCRLAGFADNVYGYATIINGASYARGIVTHGTPYIPDSKGLAALVDACRQLQRVGDHEISSITIEASDCAAWVAAFCKWSLELPPSIQFPDGAPVVTQPGAQLTIILDIAETTLPRRMKIIKKFKIESVQDLITETSSRITTTYRVQFQTYCDLLRAFCGSQIWAREAIFAALPLAIRQVRTRLRSGGYEKPFRRIDILPPVQAPLSTQNQTLTRPSAFPEDSVLCKTMCLVLGLDPDFPFDSLASAKSFWCLPEVENFFRLAKGHRMDSIFPGLHLPRKRVPVEDMLGLPWWTEADNVLLHSPDTVQLFAMKLGEVCATILSLSLFDNLEDLHLTPPGDVYGDSSDYPNYQETIHGMIRDILVRGDHRGRFDAYQIWQQTRRLLMHRFEQSEYANATLANGQKIVQSTQTHVFWYSVLDNPVPRTNGYARISSCRGQLMYKGQVYNGVRFTAHKPSYTSSLMEESPAVAVIEKFCSNADTQWQVTVDQDSLCAELSFVQRENPQIIYSSVNPLMALQLLASSVFINCEHPADGRIEKHPGIYKAPHGNAVGGRLIQTPAFIFPVGGAGHLQLYCLSWIGSAQVQVNQFTPAPPTVVVRQRACFDCCIRVCKEMDAHYLIL
jgi:hypothetical protein